MNIHLYQFPWHHLRTPVNHPTASSAVIIKQSLKLCWQQYLSLRMVLQFSKCCCCIAYFCHLMIDYDHYWTTRAIWLPHLHCRVLSIKVTWPITYMVSPTMHGVHSWCVGIPGQNYNIHLYPTIGSCIWSVFSGPCFIYYNNSGRINILHKSQEWGSELERWWTLVNKWIIWKSLARWCKTREEGSTIDCRISNLVCVLAYC